MPHAPKFLIRDDIEVPQKTLEGWQRLLDLMAEVFAVPAALIMRVRADEIEVFKCSDSEGNVYEKGERAPLDSGLYCERVMSDRNYLLVPNALRDPEWDHNPDIKLGMIAYLGFPLTWPTGDVFGTICVLDRRENRFSETYVRLLEQFRNVVEDDLRVIDAERQLRESEVRYRTMFNSVLDAIYVCTPDGSILDANEVARGNSGYELADLISHSLTDLLALTPDAWERDIRAQLEEEGVFRVDTLHVRRDGKPFPVEVQIVPMALGESRLCIAVAHDISSRKALEEELQRLATTDPLTGVSNRMLFQLELDGEMSAADRYGRGFSLAFIDLDHFKRVNDTYGHAAGDQVLVETTRTITGVLRHADRLYRYGGEEFVILMRDTDTEGAHQLAERIRATVAQRPVTGIGAVTLSIGVTRHYPGDTRSELIARADRAVYAAKAAGRDRVVVVE